jgi:hypothetical protein
VVSEYTAIKTTIIAPTSNVGINSFTAWENEAYISTQTVFFDFDIIQLTFAKDGVFTVIPVVSNPIDIVNDIVPPYDMPDDDWWKDLLKKVLFWVAVVVIFLLIFPFLPAIIMTVFNILLLPFRWIIRLFKGDG